MASSDFVRDILTKWDLSQWIKIFEEQEIDKESFLLLEEKDFIHLIPKIGPRTKFAHKHKLLKEQNKHSNVEENFEVATSSTASIKTAKSSSGNSMPSTSVDKLLSEKRKHEVANTKMQRKKQKSRAASIDLPPMFDVTEDYNKIKELMVCSSTIPMTTILYPYTEFQCQTVEGQTNVQEPRIITSQHIRRPTYRLQCPEAGLFQSGLTGLVFEMAGKGDVRVKISKWDTSVLGSMTPAGPLFSIKCQAVLKLHLPHCMCDDEEVLSVAHFTGGTMEIVKPLKTTASHVVVNIPNPSLVGLIRCGLSTLPVQSRVLLFLCPQGNTNQKGILNVFLLPKNVPTYEVEHQQKGSTFIQTSSECTLSPGRKYGLCCELVDYNLHLKSRTFDGDFSPNFLPTFQVNLECISDAKNMNLTLLDRETNDQKVWECVVQTG